MFHSLLKRIRIEKGISQTELAQAIGVSPGNVGDWERGRSKPGYDALRALSHYFEVSTDYLLEIACSPEEKRPASFEQDNHSIICDGKPLNEIESALVAMFRLLPSYIREEVFDVVYFMHQKYVEKKKESIYWTYIKDKEERQKKAIRQNDEENSGTA